MNQALILFAHGAREPRWAEPLELLLRRIRALRPKLEVRLAFLEIMKPDLRESITELTALGYTAVKVVPIFFGEGGHVRRDLPVLLDHLRMEHPGLAIVSTPPVGEEPKVLDAIAWYCLGGLEVDSDLS